MRTRRTLVRSLISLVLLGACADEGDPAQLADAERQNSAFDEVLSQNEDLGIPNMTMSMSTEEVRCAEDGIRDSGVDMGGVVTGEDLEGQVLITDVLIDCMDEPAENEDFVEAMRVSIGAGASIDLSTPEARCLVVEIIENSPEPARTIVQATESEDLAVLLDSFETCLTAENLASIMGEAGTGPQTYGDDPRFDRLYDECSAGDLRTCDLLFMLATEGSDYAQLASDCGGHPPVGASFCSPEVELDDTGFAPEDAAGLEVLARDCTAGDLTACDLLYQIAPFGSPHEQTGFTCGARIGSGALPDCRTRLG